MKLLGLFLATVACGSMLAAAPAEPSAQLRTDLDGDGVAEQIAFTKDHIVVTRGGVSESFPLPEGVSTASGGDVSVRFADLNGDGHADLLFASESWQAIYLWTKEVRPKLGWERGWSHRVSSGPRGNDARALPPLAGTSVLVEAGNLRVRLPDGSKRSYALRELIALPMPPPVPPSAAVASLRLPEGFRAELVVHEPEITAPVAFDWGADGRFWVVEMNDYPTGMDGNGKPGGVVKTLRDTDGDSVYDRAIVFADALPFPTGIMPWRDGVLVAAAPDILYLRDTDGDGRADKSEVLFTGFHPGNQQHRFNGFEWGLDGWIYAANGDSGGTVRSTKTGASVKISGRDVRFRPDTGEIETVSGMTQYGLRRNDWGHWFGNNNPAWLWHVTLPERYLKRNPRLAVKRVKKALANGPENTRVYPASQPVERPNQPWSMNHVTSACSPTPYRDDLFGPSFADTVFIAEPVHNVIHREVLHRDGSGWRSLRAPGEEEREFVAGTDNWFRPVFLRTGPDGALWVADIYRFVLEHPEWISPEMQSRVDVRAGADRGRIYRILPSAAPRRAWPFQPGMDAPALARALRSANGWTRDTAHRLLLDRSDAALAVPVLRELLGPANLPAVRLQALAILGTILPGALDADSMLAGLRDPHPWVRCEALRQTESATGDGFESVSPVIAAMVRDGDPAVRLQLAFTLGAFAPARSEPLLAALVDGADEDLLVAIQSSLTPDSALFAQIQTSGKKTAAAAAIPVELIGLKPSSDDRGKVIASYGGMQSRTGNAESGRALFETNCASCHRLRGLGKEVGPDLDMVSTKPTDWLLANILDPAQTVEARYQSLNIALRDGTALVGIIALETSNNVVLRLPGGTEYAVLRADIAKMTRQPGSLMPAGFETVLPETAMADLLEWIVRGK